MENIKVSQVFKILHGIYDLDYVKPCCNERYLHHYFTEKIQKHYPIVYEDFSKSKMHPEWATANQIRLNGGKYKKENKIYITKNDGSSGFIDFAIGDYCNPLIGIEFKLCKSWAFQSIVFDFMKLMDSANQIQKAISFSIICRDNELSNRLNDNIINTTIVELEKRLGSSLSTNREFLFWIIEVSVKSKDKKSWYCTNINDKFIRGIP